MKESVLVSFVFATLTSGLAIAADLPEVESLTKDSPAPYSYSYGNEGGTGSYQQEQYPNAHDTAIGYQDSAYQQNDNDYVEDVAVNSNPMMSLFQKVNALQDEVQMLRGKIEEQNHKLETLHQAQRSLYLDLDRRLRDGGPQKLGGVSSLSLAELNDSAKPELSGNLDAQIASQYDEPVNRLVQNLDVQNFDTQASPSQIASEEKAYQQAYQFIQNKDYESALSAFKSMIKTYPDGKYKANGHYWMGEIYMVQGELELAANEFNTVYQNHPQHAKAADALLKLGYVEYAKGKWKRSHELLSKVKSEFPGTSSARLANTRLQRMQQEGRL